MHHHDCLSELMGFDKISNYYAVLGVKFTADTSEIRCAYRRLAKEFHPDRHRGEVTATARFQAIQQAYDVLSDQEQRRLYDIGLVDHLNVEDYLSRFKEMTLTVSGLGIACPKTLTRHALSVCHLQHAKALQMLTA